MHYRKFNHFLLIHPCDGQTDNEWAHSVLYAVTC